VQTRSKYGNRKTEVDGIMFDSVKEANRYRLLVILQGASQIYNLRRQVRYPLHVNGVKIGTYVADFVYELDVNGAAGETIVEDVKGVRTPMYQWKRKHLKAEYGIEILEV
jgi:hypothetical protein